MVIKIVDNVDNFVDNLWIGFIKIVMIIIIVFIIWYGSKVKKSNVLSCQIITIE